jgi:membrane protease subunit HflC
LRIIAQAYAIWQIPSDPEAIKRFVLSVENQPDQAATQIRTFLGSSLQTTTSNFDLSSLINPDPDKLRIDALEAQLKTRIAQQLFDTYGLQVIDVGIERLTLPSVTLNATVDRMRAERETIATERAASGKRQAAEIRSAAERDARVLQADATVKAAGIEAKSRVEAAQIYGTAYKSAPELYELLRSLDTLGTIVNSNTHLVLRTDAAPFRALVDGPPSASAASGAR